jgi:hypothetical protein
MAKQFMAMRKMLHSQTSGTSGVEIKSYSTIYEKVKMPRTQLYNLRLNREQQLAWLKLD